MERFERSDEGTDDEMPSERLQAFTKAVWDALVPSHGECISVQGELIRANERLQSEYWRNGMGNYYCPDDDGDALVDNHYGQLLVFMLDTLIRNHNQPLDDDDVAYFKEVRALVERDWTKQLRCDELSDKEEELSDAENEELQSLEERPDRPNWEDIFNRTERCIANWCIANRVLVDRRGEPVEEGGIRDLAQVFEPPPAPAPCPLCNGKGWLPAKTPSDFPELCACKKS